MGIERAVVLVSGGLDSATCLAIASKVYEVHALTFDYGSRHSRETESAETLAKHFKAKSHTILKIDLAAIGGSSLTDQTIPLEQGKKPGEIGKSIPTSYVPARNLTFLSLGIALAEARGAQAVFIGANSVDYSGYPDCRPQFIEAFQRVIDLGTKDTTKIMLKTPFIHMTKTDILNAGMKLGVPYEHTWSCYQNEDKACGTCGSCHFRKEAFAAIGRQDPIPYEE